MDQHFLKITYHLGGNKMHAYINMPPTTYNALKKEINIYLFAEREQTRCDIRIYWIDEDGDKIDICWQNDYEAFISQCSGGRHLHVSPLDTAEAELTTATNSSETSNYSAPNEAKIPPAAGLYDSAVHDRVECDSCLMLPIVGFRYKCMQCKDYDLCEHCESKHFHSEHMMVRMPNKNCFPVIKDHVSGRTSRRGNDEKVGENDEQSSPANKQRHHRNNFFSHLYEMMNDLGEGGGADAAAHAMGESTASSKATTSTNGSQATGTTTTSDATGFENNEIPLAAAASAAAAKFASQKAHEAAIKAAEITAKIATQNMNTSTFSTASTASPTAAESDEEEKDNEKVDATSAASNPEPQPNSVPITPPSLENLAQFLDPKNMKNGVQILNNFNETFAKMLDPMENSECANSQNDSNLRKNSTTCTKSSVSSNLNNLGCDKKSNGETSLEKEKIHENGNDASSFIEIDDLDSDSGNESTSGTFIKISAPVKENSSIPSTSKSATAISSVENTPEQSLNKSNVIDFAQLGAVLQAYIAHEATTDTIKSLENVIEDKANEVLTPVTSTTTSDPDEKRSVHVYHSDRGINKAVHAMVAMGFSNEGAWLTQLLESVNGNITEALDFISAARRGVKQ